MLPIIKKYNSIDNSTISTFRTIVLFGLNVSTYKFALCSALLKQNPKNEVRYDELRDDFLKELLEHYTLNPHQYQAGSNSLTKAFDNFKTDKDWQKLVSIAENNIYNNVFDAFHNVGGSSIKKEFVLFEHDPKQKKLILTDNINEILENSVAIETIQSENQVRWMLVEEAWKNSLSPNILDYNKQEGNFYSISITDRINLRSAVPVLLPYQHGRCFYCNRLMNTKANKEEEDFPDVDHFLPHSFLNRQGNLCHINSNGIWNLVISCKDCNRGESGKFHSPPAEIYQQGLITRNILFTQEHRHSLKNSILLSLNASDYNDVHKKMLKLFSYFDKIVGWKPKIIYK